MTDVSDRLLTAAVPLSIRRDTGAAAEHMSFKDLVSAEDFSRAHEAILSDPHVHDLGSGLLVEVDGLAHVATAAHVVSFSDRELVRINVDRRVDLRGNAFPLSSVPWWTHTDRALRSPARDRDTAVLVLPTLARRWAEVGYRPLDLDDIATDPPAPGEELVTVHFSAATRDSEEVNPNGPVARGFRLPSVTEREPDALAQPGVVWGSAVADVPAGHAAAATLPVAEGASGAPVMRVSDGKIVGLVVAAVVVDGVTRTLLSHPADLRQLLTRRT